MKLTLHKSTRSGPGLVAFQNRLFLGWAGIEPGGGLLHITQSTNGESFPDDILSDQIVNGADVRLAFLANHLCVGLIDCATGAPMVIESNDDLSFKSGSGAVRGLPTEESSHSPAICNFQGELIVSWTAANGQINVASYDGKSVGHHVRLTEHAGSGVALASDSNRLFIAWAEKGPRQHLNLLTSSDGRNFGGKISLPDETTENTPSLAWLDGSLYMAWAGTQNGWLNIVSSADLVHFSKKTTLDDSSSHSPAIAAFNNKIWLAWKGTDVKSRPNVMCVNP